MKGVPSLPCPERHIPMPSTLTIQAAALVRLLRAADTVHLPLGQCVTINTQGQIELQLSSPEDVQVWAEWINAEVTTKPTVTKSGTLYNVSGKVYDLEYGNLHVSVYTVTFDQAGAVA